MATDGRYFYILGGFSSSAGNDRTEVYRYDPPTNGWTPMAPIPAATSFASAVYWPATHKIYLFGGKLHLSGDPFTATRIYDIATNTWSTGASLPAPRAYMTTARDGGQIYLAGGSATAVFAAVASVYRYNPGTNGFTPLASLPVANGAGAGEVINGHFYVAGGSTGSGVPSDVLYDYDIGLNSWSTRAPMPFALDHLTSGAIEGRMFVFGGGFNGSLIYTPATDSWLYGPGPRFLRRYAGSHTVIGSRIYAATGDSGGGSSSHAQVFTATNTVDFDGGCATDYVVLRPSNGGSQMDWYILNHAGFSAFPWGIFGTDTALAGDYDGDTKTDASVWRSGTFYIKRSTNGSLLGQQFGQSGDDARVPGDYDGDHKTDLAVWRPTGGTWFYWRSSNATLGAQQFGISSDTAAPGDYDGDGIADFAVRRGDVFHILQSRDGYTAIPWGFSTDYILPGRSDYDGDGKTDIAVWRYVKGAANEFYVRSSFHGGLIAMPFGTDGDMVVPGDYDSDGLTDFAVWRPGEGTFYAWASRPTFPRLIVRQFGAFGDFPLASFVIH
jgi:hypothetical protein